MPFELGGNILGLQLLGTLFVLLGLFGWGELAAAPFRWAGERPWGFTLALGVGACVAVGGALSLFDAVSVWANVTVVAIGVLAAVGSRWLKARRAAASTASPGERVRRDPLELAFHGIAITYLVVTALGATRPVWAEVPDDFTASLEFPRRLLQTGTFVEPMSSRRIATLGGGVYLQ
ncbi:MAG TPA: hypothetical protein VLT61_14475, partial [Anaeromyxobacteraceae bacterium]|nr:hypothetical protein [Anaeromyxobacteraceae bacterium]